MGYKIDKEWADAYVSQVKKILRRNIGEMVEIVVAPHHDDCKRATDMLLRISGSDVASRVRRPCQGYRDLTVRSRRESGHRTELDKLRDGHCDWYFYGWAEDGLIDEWMIVDMNKVRAEGLLDKERYEISNKDGTYFVAVSARELFDCGCIAAHELPDWCLP